MPWGGDSGRRARRHLSAFLMLAAIGLGWLLSLGIAYRAGTTEQATTIKALTDELDLQGGLVRDLSRRAAMAEQQLAAARAELTRFTASTAQPAAPANELEALGGLIDRRLREGVSPAQLRATIEALVPMPACTEAPEVRSFLARTPVTREPTTARFAGGRIVVAGSGVSARNPNGRPEAWFDARQPVELRIEVGQATTTASGVLPMRHTVVRDQKEYRFEMRPHSKRGFIEVQMTVC